MVSERTSAGEGVIPVPTGSDAGWVWRALVVGLLVVIVLALGGIIWAIGDGNPATSPDLLVTVFSSALTGLIGLFVKSPTQ
ncbi:hypothetical protein SAMN05444920_13467 [Nonomuraea solani]|uniref:Uncharacterized protein n=1 Tax=Nonomuraea solani TaxID=1144553 RepID=A0A1H6F104_9ACTN|nr:hypothetical protein [Nonomuraea solani]SEH03263.1 hypothetical protein SAMN05444920_13467 [Nonomuraea solani]